MKHEATYSGRGSEIGGFEATCLNIDCMYLKS